MSFDEKATASIVNLGINSLQTESKADNNCKKLKLRMARI